MEKTVLGFIDMETTGHDPIMRVSAHSESVNFQIWHEIIDLGCVFVEIPGFKALGEYSVKITPAHPERCIPNLINHYPERALRGEWDNAVTLTSAVAEFFRKCREIFPDGTVVVPGGQNWFFDWSFLSAAFARLGVGEKQWGQFLSYKKFDTGSMALQALWDPRTPLDFSNFSIRSGKLQKLLNISPEPIPHTALNGAWQAYEVFKKLSELKLKTS